jgi:hypothetical protein
MSLQAVRIINSATALPEQMGSENAVPLQRRLRVLLLKPFQPIAVPTHSPPIGLLYLVSNMRAVLGEHIDIKIIDMKLHHMSATDLDPVLQSFQPDVVGFSALNYEAHATHVLAKRTKEFDPSIITVFGGPYALKMQEPFLMMPMQIGFLKVLPTVVLPKHYYDWHKIAYQMDLFLACLFASQKVM